jgi:hypothetical protein
MMRLCAVDRESEIGDAQRTASASECDAHALSGDTDKDSVDRLGILVGRQGRESRLGKLIEVNYSCVTVLCLRKNDPIVQQVHTAKCTCVTQTVTVFVGRERRERVSHHNWSGDA